MFLPPIGFEQKPLFSFGLNIVGLLFFYYVSDSFTSNQKFIISVTQSAATEKTQKFKNDLKLTRKNQSASFSKILTFDSTDKNPRVFQEKLT